MLISQRLSTAVTVAVPSAAPENIDARMLNSTTAIFRWRPPDEEDMNGDLKGFKVRRFKILSILFS